MAGDAKWQRATIYKSTDGTYCLHSYSRVQREGRTGQEPTGPYVKINSGASAQEVGDAAKTALEASQDGIPSAGIELQQLYREKVLSFMGVSTWDEYKQKNIKCIELYAGSAAKENDIVQVIPFRNFIDQFEEHPEPMFEIEADIKDPSAEDLGNRILESFEKIPDTEEKHYTQEELDARKPKQAKAEDLPEHLQFVKEVMDKFPNAKIPKTSSSGKSGKNNKLTKEDIASGAQAFKNIVDKFFK